MRSSQHGFTLVEILVTILIIGILSAIAIAVFNGQRAKAHHATTQTTVQHALVVSKSYFTLNNSFMGLTTNYIHRKEDSIPAATPTDPSAKKPGSSAINNAVFLYNGAGTGAPDHDGVTMCAVSKASNVFCARTTVSEGTVDETVYATGKGNVDTVASSATFSKKAWKQN